MKIIDIHIHIDPDDPAMDRYVRQMDKHGVESALIHGTMGYTNPVLRNEYVAKAVKRHPQRLFGSVFIDLRQPVRACIRDVRQYARLGFKCVKLFPNLGFDPNDDRYEPFWDAVESAGLMVFAHCGWLTVTPALAFTSSLTATPFHFEKPARRHPKINFIFAHFGGAPAYLETIVLISRLANCYADTCPGWGRWVWEQHLPGLESVPRDKVCYGTDNAGVGYGRGIRWWQRALRSYGYKKPDLQLYFHDIAARLLRLN